MRIPEYSTQFHRDVKRAAKRGRDMDKLKVLLRMLIEGDTLSPRYKDHPLKQNWQGYRDAHIEPDWLLIYAIVESMVERRFVLSAPAHRAICSTDKRLSRICQAL